jgi:hypothetical protein
MEARSSYHDLKRSIEADVSYSLTKRPGDPQLTEAVDKLGLGIDIKRYKVAGLHVFATGYSGKQHGNLNVTFIVDDLKNGSIRKIAMEIEPKKFFQLFEHLDIYLFHDWFKNDPNSHIDKIPEVEE